MVDTVKNRKGTFLVVLTEIVEGGYWCVFPDGTKRILLENQLNMTVYSEFADEDRRMTVAQKQAVREFNSQEFSYDCTQLNRAL